MRREIEAFGDALVGRAGRLAGRAQERHPLPNDLLESDEAYLVVFDAPDVDIDDVQVRFADGTVHVRIDRTREHREGFEMRFPGRGMTLDGHVDLPAGVTVDPDGATAKLTDTGVLRIEIPKVDDPDDGPVRIPTDEPVDEPDPIDADEGTDDPDAYDPGEK